MHAHRGQGHTIRRQATGAAGVIGVKHHDTGDGPVKLFFVKLFEYFDDGGRWDVFFWAFHGLGRKMDAMQTLTHRRRPRLALARAYYNQPILFSRFMTL